MWEFKLYYVCVYETIVIDLLNSSKIWSQDIDIGHRVKKMKWCCLWQVKNIYVSFSPNARRTHTTNFHLHEITFEKKNKKKNVQFPIELNFYNIKNGTKSCNFHHLISISFRPNSWIPSLSFSHLVFIFLS